MDPRTHHQRVVRAGTLLLRGAIQAQGAEQVFGVEPAADSHHRRLHVFHMLADVAGLPVVAIDVVIEDLSPVLDLAVKKLLVEILQRAGAQVEFVAVGRSVVEWHRAGRARLAAGANVLPEVRQESKRVRQEKCAVVTEIVAMNHSETGACGELAFMAGCASIAPLAA